MVSANTKSLLLLHLKLVKNFILSELIVW